MAINRVLKTRNTSETHEATFGDWTITFNLTYEVNETNIVVNVSATNSTVEGSYFYAQRNAQSTSFNFNNIGFDFALVTAIMNELDDIFAGQFDDVIEPEQ